MIPLSAFKIKQLYNHQKYDVGATLPKRDIVDARIIDETRGGYATYEGPTYEQNHDVSDPAKKSGIIDSPADVGGWPELKSATAPTDTDHDGMPDAWETRYGLDPADPADGPADLDDDGYSNLEEFLNATVPTVYVDYHDPANNRFSWQVESTDP